MYKLIKGGSSTDYRGQVKFINDFDMTPAKRFYIIKNEGTEIVRGWRAHMIESRWFYVLSGRFEIKIVQIVDPQNVSKNSLINGVILSGVDNSVLYIPPGYGTAIRAIEDDSEMLVFADRALDEAHLDDHTYPLDYFVEE